VGEGAEGGSARGIVAQATGYVAGGAGHAFGLLQIHLQKAHHFVVQARDRIREAEVRARLQ
jgi:hypothetical protein